MIFFRFDTILLFLWQHSLSPLSFREAILRYISNPSHEMCQNSPAQNKNVANAGPVNCYWFSNQSKRQKQLLFSSSIICRMRWNVNNNDGLHILLVGTLSFLFSFLVFVPFVCTTKWNENDECWPAWLLQTNRRPCTHLKRTTKSIVRYYVYIFSKSNRIT